MSIDQVLPIQTSSKPSKVDVSTKSDSSKGVEKEENFEHSLKTQTEEKRQSKRAEENANQEKVHTEEAQKSESQEEVKEDQEVEASHQTSAQDECSKQEQQAESATVSTESAVNVATLLDEEKSDEDLENEEAELTDELVDSLNAIGMMTQDVQAEDTMSEQVVNELSENSDDKLIDAIAAEEIPDATVRESHRFTRNEMSDVVNEEIKQVAPDHSQGKLKDVVETLPNEKSEAAQSLASQAKENPHIDEFAMLLDNVRNDRATSLQNSHLTTKHFPTLKGVELSVSKQITETLAASIQSKKNSIEIQLKPPEWGKVQVRIEMKDHEVGLSILSENSAVKEVIQKSMPQLRQDLFESGYQLGNSSVDVGDQQQWQYQGDVDDYNDGYYDRHDQLADGLDQEELEKLEIRQYADWKASVIDRRI